MNLSSILQVFLASFLLILDKKIALAVSFTATLEECPPGFEKVSNNCYQFSNYSSISLTHTEAALKCAEHTNTTTANFSTSLFHLVGLESLGETISLYYFLKGGEFNHSFWIDPVRHFEWDWLYEFSGHKFISHGYLSDIHLNHNLTEKQNYMYLRHNGSEYELHAASVTGDHSTVTQNMGYACEAQIPCKNPEENCRNNGTCYVNTGKVLCICPPGYTGILCEVIINTCDSAPCLNGGNCTSGIDTYSCDCTGLFFEGTDCEIEIPNPKENTRSFAWILCVTIVSLLIGFLCLMDFPFMLVAEKFNEKKNKLLAKAKAKKESMKIKKMKHEQKSKQKSEQKKKDEAKKAAKVEIKPERFLSSEEEMLRRFRVALAASNQTNAPKKDRKYANEHRPSYKE